MVIVEAGRGENERVEDGSVTGCLVGVLLLGGQLVGGRGGLVIGFGLAVAMNFFSYFFSEKLALKMSGAEAVTPESHPDIYRRLEPITRDLTQRMSLPMPRLG